jgi:hypothetical protein
VEEAFGLGCDTVVMFLNMPKNTVRVAPHPLRDLLELNDPLRLNERYIHHRVIEAQLKAKALGVNLFVVRPDEIPPGLGLLEIDAKVIESVKNNEQKRMREYLANLERRNLRFIPLSLNT